VVGVLEPSFFGLQPGDTTAVYVPLHHAASRGGWNIVKWMENDRMWGLQMIARLSPATDAVAIRTAMDSVFRSTWSKQPSNESAAPHVRLSDGSRGLGSLSQNLRNPLLVLATLVGLLLVIACANIANLLLARAVARRKEIALRVSLGCTRGRLVRQFLTESALIALLGGAISLPVAYGTGSVLGQFVGRTPLEAALDFRVLLLVAAISCGALALFAVLPAWQGSRIADASWLKQGGGSIGTARRRKWDAGRTLVVAQMAMSVVLVMAAVIFTRNLLAVEGRDPGFDRRNLVMFGVMPGPSGYDAKRLPQFYFDLEQRLAATPGVSAAGLTWMRPMNIGGWWDAVRLAGQSDKYQASMNGVTPSYLPLFAPRLIAGRNITWADIQADAKVAVISEDLARRLGGTSILGHRLQLPDGPPGQPAPEYEIVGIAPAFAATSMKERPFAVWVPFKKDGVEATVVVRTSQSPGAVLPAIRETIHQIDANLPMVETITMQEQIAKTLERERMFATLCGGFGLLAVALSVVGLYGVMAYNTSRRRTEIGVRLALGALPRTVLAMVLREGLVLALAGIVLGLPVVWLCAKYAQKELYQMKVVEPASIASAVAILALAALVAVIAPAARASWLDPAETLREQ
jgi:predicted permease